MRMRQSRGGFTLVEMLVVMGIIAVLAGALIAGFGSVTKAAQRAKAQEAVSNAATALALFYQENNNEWPAEMMPGDQKMGVEVAKLLAWGHPLDGERGQNLLGVNFKGEEGAKITLLGTDRLGILDPWGAAVLKRNPGASTGTAVPSGGTIEDHKLYFAVDTDGDGITEARLQDGTRKIRATAVVWCAGRDGVLAPYSKAGRSDDVYSWTRGQEQSK